MFDFQKLNPIPVNTTFAPEFSDTPIIFRGVLNRSRAVQTWSFDSLAARVGELQVTLRQYQADSPQPFLDQCVTQTRKTTLSEYLHALRTDADPSWVMRESWEIPATRPGLFEELDPPDILKGLSHYVWCGPAHYVTGLHADLVELNVLSQIIGRKEVVLYPASQEDNLYVQTQSPIQDGLYSYINAYAPDLEQHPKFRNAEGFVGTLQPGDLLYIPRRMWHIVRALDASLSVTLAKTK